MKRFFVPKRKLDVHVALSTALLVAIAQLISARQTIAQTTTYTVVELSAPDEQLVPTRLNNLGDVVGRGAAGGPGQSRSTLWNRRTLLPRRLGVFSGGEYSSAFAINDAGDVAGASN